MFRKILFIISRKHTLIHIETEKHFPLKIYYAIMLCRVKTAVNCVDNRDRRCSCSRLSVDRRHHRDRHSRRGRSVMCE